MNSLDQREIEQHCTILGWLNIVGHAVFLAIGLFVFVLLTGIGTALVGQDPVAPRVLTVVGTAVGLLLAILAVPGLAAGYGLLTRRPWARVVALVVAFLGLVNFPFGTAIGIYAIWVLMQPGAVEYFHPNQPAQSMTESHRAA
jgi:ABC-type transport system involved in multi-copper enzyme maturation permease subunit